MSELLKSLLTTLGLPETTKDTDAVAAVAALKARADKTAALEGEIATLKAQTPDPARFVPVAAMRELQTQVATLTQTMQQRDLDEIVTAALAAGKLLPAQERWARELGASNMAALKSYVETAHAIPALRGTQSGGRGPAAAASGDPVAAAKAKFDSDADIRAEFGDLATYTAWCRAEAEGRVKILGRTQH